MARKGVLSPVKQEFRNVVVSILVGGSAVIVIITLVLKLFQ